MALVKIQNRDDFKDLLQKKSRFLFLKNSLTCPISQNAFNVYKSFANSDEDCYYLNVQESRDLSNEIVQNYGVKHDTPQVLLFEDNKVTFNESHWAITSSLLEEKWKNK